MVQRFQKLHGVRLKNATGLPSVQINPEDEAMASIPGWKMYLDPVYADLPGMSIRNRAQPASHIVGAAAPGAAQMPNGAPAISLNGADTPRTWTGVGNVAFNPTAWSMFWVIMPIAIGSAYRWLVRPIDAVSTALSPAVRLSGSGNTLALVESIPGQDSIRASWNNAGLASRTAPSLLMVSFSTQAGVHIFDGGNVVASAPNDRRPLTGNFAAGAWSLLTVTSSPSGFGLVGEMGLHDIDLSLPVNAGYRRDIERYLMALNGIPA